MPSQSMLATERATRFCRWGGSTMKLSVKMVAMMPMGTFT